jgi:hypothetical protein|tara:strand:- start:800 stop:1063 length:264 start_codon:yes stop_codon:yes gene_type:complete
MKKKILFLLLTLCQNIFAEEISSNTKEIMIIENFTVSKECSSYEKIEGKEYCVKRSSITLNSCGPLSDWPCMEEQGCLIIDKFTLKD